MALQKGEVVSWAVVLFLGLGTMASQIRTMSPNQAHRVFEFGIASMLGVGCGINITIMLTVDEGSKSPTAAAEKSSVAHAAATEMHATTSNPVWAIVSNLFVCLSGMVCINCLHLSAWVKVLSLVLPVVTHAANPIFPELGDWHQETRLIAAGLVAGAVLGYVLERSARDSFLHGRERQRLEVELVKRVAEADSSRLRTTAHRVINHTSKRVMCNTVQICDIAIRRLQQQGFRDSDCGAEGRDLISLLRAHSAESIGGFHMCRSVLFRASVSAGEYEPQLETFTLDELFDELGFPGNARFECHVSPDRGKAPHTDKLLLQTILFNAAQNALLHGRAGGMVHASAELVGDSLCIKMRNEPGRNHSSLLAL
eukprot:7389724-Prymnesium_polylepis.1